MDKARNFSELKEELDSLGFNTREFINDIRKAVYENTLYKQVAYRDREVSLNLNFGRSDFARLTFFDYGVLFPGDKKPGNFQAFEAEVPLSEAKQLVKVRIKSQLYDIPDAQTPLFLSDVRLEQRALDQNKLNSPGVYGDIDTIKLEKRMQAIDWHQHPGHWADHRDDRNNKQLMENTQHRKRTGCSRRSSGKQGSA